MYIQYRTEQSMVSIHYMFETVTMGSPKTELRRHGESTWLAANQVGRY